MITSKIVHKEYWEKNIKGFSGFYDKGSDEKIDGPVVVTAFYKSVIFPIEKALMKKRFQITVDFIDRNVFSGKTVADIGCGSGIFTKYMVFCGAKVYAIDFTQNALSLTAESLSSEESSKVEFLRQDITDNDIPRVDVSIAMGVLPYIKDARKFFCHVLPFTDSLFFNYLDKDILANVIRQEIKALDPRGYSYHETKDIMAILSAAHFEIVNKTRLGQGFVVEAKRKNQLG